MTWKEVRSTVFGFLEESSCDHQERQDGVDWFVDGNRVQVTYTAAGEGENASLRVEVRTNIGEFDQRYVDRASTLAARLNGSLPLSVFVAEDSQVSLRLVLNLYSTGRTLFRFLRAAVLMQAYYAKAARELLHRESESVIGRGFEPACRVASEGREYQSPADELGASLLASYVPSADAWLLQRWPVVRQHLIRVMEDCGFPLGWGNHEVQFFNPGPPDIAVAVLDPEHTKHGHLGRGFVVQARLLPPLEELETQPDDWYNALNLALLKSGGSVLGGFTPAERARTMGLAIDLWVPCYALAHPSMGDRDLAIYLGNLVLHAAGASFELLRSGQLDLDPLFPTT